MGDTKKKERRKMGDRFDGKLLRDLDAMHIITPLLYPNRCDNEAYISETFDMAPIRAYVDKKNAENPVFKYTMFHVFVTAILKLIVLRPKLNRFIQNKNMYQRNEITASFVVKKLFTDDAEEALAIIKAQPSDTADTIHEQLYKQISSCKDASQVDGSTNAMNIVSKIPRPIMKFFVGIICWLDRIGHCPRGLIETDPYYTSVVLSNVGSIKLRSGYHHLVNWGTNSIFGLLGEIKTVRELQADGTVTEKEVVNLGITVDERLSDGYYYSKSVRLLKTIMANPDCLDLPLDTPVDYK